jgi:hypothetical protein
LDNHHATHARDRDVASSAHDVRALTPCESSTTAAVGPPPAHGSPPRLCGSVLDFSVQVATWNCRGLALSKHSDPVIYEEKVKYLQSVLKVVEVAALQEVHGTLSGTNETFKQFAGWTAYCSPGLAPGAGFVAILVHRSLMRPACSHYHRVLLDGRALQVVLQLPSVCLNPFECISSQRLRGRPSVRFFVEYWPRARPRRFSRSSWRI